MMRMAQVGHKERADEDDELFHSCVLRGDQVYCVITWVNADNEADEPVVSCGGRSTLGGRRRSNSSGCRVCGAMASLGIDIPFPMNCVKGSSDMRFGMFSDLKFDLLQPRFPGVANA